MKKNVILCAIILLVLTATVAATRTIERGEGGPAIAEAQTAPPERQQRIRGLKIEILELLDSVSDTFEDVLTVIRSEDQDFETVEDVLAFMEEGSKDSSGDGNSSGGGGLSGGSDNDDDSGGGNGGGTTASNAAPIAKAGSDTDATAGEPKQLAGTATDDGLPAGSSLTAAWSTVSGPGSVSFNDASDPATTASFSLPGTYILRLTASDGEFTDADEVTVTVTLEEPTNVAPTANAGTDESITLPADATLSGAASDDGLPSGALTTTWSEVSGPGTVTFADASDTTTTASFSEDGTYVLRLTADDGELTDADEMTVTVNPEPPEPPSNTAPIASAGADQSLTLPNTATLSGSATDDGLPTGSSLSYAWSEVSGPGTVTFADASDPTTTASFSADGTYVLRLTVSDSDLTDTDDVTVTVAPEPPEPPENTAPTADAGSDEAITLPSSVNLSGSAIDDGLPSDTLTTTWSEVSGPGTVIFTDASDATTVASFSEDGIYTLRFTADDGEFTDADDVTITVNPEPPENTAPIADAGGDTTATVGVAKALSGSATDDELPSGTLTTAWSEMSGPGTVTFSDASSVTSTATFSTAGTYVLRLTADDGELTDIDDVTITVSSSFPAEWTSADIGAVGLSGSATYESGTFTIEAAGEDIWNTADGFHYVYQQLTGDGEITARVVSVENVYENTKAGVMFREDLSTGSLNVMIEERATNGVAFQWRSTAGAVTDATTGSAATAPYWLKLTRIDDTIRGYESSNGTDWSLVGAATVNMSETVYVGLAVTSHEITELATAVFDNVSIANEVSITPPPPSSISSIYERYVPTGPADYYVSTTGSDSNSGTSASDPFRTIAHASTVVGPGDTVEVAPGTYTGDSNATNGIRTFADGTAGNRIVYYSSELFGATIDGSGDYNAWRNDGDYIDIIGFEVTGSDYGGIIAHASYNRVIANHVHHLATPACNSPNGGAGINQTNYNAEGGQIVGNLVHHIEAPDADGSSTCGLVHALYFAHPGGRIVNNIVYQTSGWGIHTWHFPQDLTIANNLIFESDLGGIIIGGDELTANGFVVTNNIIINNRYGIREHGTIGTTNVYINNLVWNNEIDWDLENSTHEGTITADPELVNYQRDGSGNYHLTAGSLAVDAGTTTGAPTYDYAGTIRPQGGGIDIGPYEYVSSTNTAPTASAGSDQSITLPNTATLSGSATDDGLPTGSSLSYAWSEVSGPGTVTFADASDPTTTASFSTDGTYVLRLTASDSDVTDADDITVTVNPGVPSPWTSTDIGTVGLTSTASFDSGTFTINAASDDIWGTEDSFHFVYQQLTGDGEITARVVSAANVYDYSKTGVMFRENLMANSPNAIAEIRPTGGVAFQWRLTAGGTTDVTEGSDVDAPYWLKLTRIDDTIRGYESSNGTDWSLVDSIAIDLPETMYTGLAVASHEITEQGTGVFDNVSISNEVSITPPPPSSISSIYERYVPDGPADWYVSTTGSDTNSGTSPSDAFATIDQANSVAEAGDTIEVASGTYNGVGGDADAIETTTSGTAESRIVYYSAEPGGAVIDATGYTAAWDNEGSYVDIIGFEVTGSGYLGIYNKGSFARIIGNEVHGLNPTQCDSNGGAGINNGDYSQQGSEIIGNIVYDIQMDDGSYCNRIHGIYHSVPGGRIVNNIVYDVVARGIQNYHAATNVVITNNLVFGNDTGILVDADPDDCSPVGCGDDMYVANNIVMNNESYGIRDYNNAGTGNLYTHNILWNNGTDITIKPENTQSGNIFADPQLVNFQAGGGGDYHLTAGSPGIDAGVATNAPAYDLDGKIRPQGGGIDIGPYEYSSSMPSGALGPLTVSDQNPRYFEDASGDVVYLTGSHTWDNLQDIDDGSGNVFNYTTYLNFLDAHNHNFTRLWAWEQSAWAPFSFLGTGITFSPLPYARTGGGTALDGGAKFDLDDWNEAYFTRLRSRVEDAAARNIYASVMLFEGFSIEDKDINQPDNNPWMGHPFNAANNVNGIDGDPNNDGEGFEAHTLDIPAVTAYQEAYVKKVIDTLNDLDNVIWEISNESHNGSTAWQYHMIDLIHSYEAGKPQQHPVVITAETLGPNTELFSSNAEAVSPGLVGTEYRSNPPVADGSKVVILDTDHVFGCGGDSEWIWEAFMRGYNPILMDPYDGGAELCENLVNDPGIVSARDAMGETLSYANRIDLATMTPSTTLCSSNYCLASTDEYLVYLPLGGSVTVDMSASAGTFNVEWFNTSTDATSAGSPVSGGGSRTFTAPASGAHVLYLSK